MKHLYIPLFLFFFLILEGVALELLPVALLTSELLIVPHWVLIFLVLTAMFYEKDTTYFSIIYALIFGLLIDVVYTGVLGVYMFSYALVIYLVLGLRKVFHGNIYVSLLLGIISVMLADVAIHVIYSAAGVIQMVWNDYAIYRLLPTVLSNIVFILILYPLFAKRLSKWSEGLLAGSDSL
ncbi:rod shape-determining protein MreD [Virgibacillus sp. YIM 98842]|jgi:rod shape-determining protein MreD|uniref:rod shape-determining protein MreD n=1 Tax=Virgibacillus sp. YIM 98842 TaxID=2663533 RepID=UPI001969F98A|nr:rod shape-determining protein MreD [Virgibacillus sp. YIM 98842]